KMPDETIKYLHSIANEEGTAAAILADDGEKFGVWPGTHKWVYEDGYLEKLLTKLEESAEWIEFMTFAQYVDEVPPLGRIYLPTASYSEMMEWSLPTESGKKLDHITEEIRRAGKTEEYSQFFKGGFFRNFLVKYPEANNMHKRMLQVSQRLQTLKKGKSLIGERERDSRLREAQKELFMGQCNCAYWHGVFGGLYLNYLRHAIYEHLLKADSLLDKYSRAKEDYAEITVTDFDRDGHDEVVLVNNLLNLYFAPHYGGALFELDYKPKNFNLLNTLARREEKYHQKISHAAAQGAAGVSSIHDIVKVKEPGLEKMLIYDRQLRWSLLDRLLDPAADLESFSAQRAASVGNFTAQPYEFMPQRRGNEVSLVMRRQDAVGGVPVKLEKTVSLCAKQSIVNITYELTNLGGTACSCRFGPEFNLSLLAGRAPDRYYEIPGVKLDDAALASRGEVSSVGALKIVDEWKGFVVLLEFDRPADLWRFPIETVSQSESGFERTYQGSV
ncbi:MAG TPA: alpha-amylase/4-alpha-glucanotransferase domain-containing protein, partial [Candidatus Sulfotelmatobacter sp.]|nr:alpha-amylase/4-alpha-glucanotransferase domain-containing protein [Candidatus Sulfotelmatobacter sp.]